MVPKDIRLFCTLCRWVQNKPYKLSCACCKSNKKIKQWQTANLRWLPLFVFSKSFRREFFSVSEGLFWRIILNRAVICIYSRPLPVQSVQRLQLKSESETNIMFVLFSVKERIFCREHLNWCILPLLLRCVFPGRCSFQGVYRVRLFQNTYFRYRWFPQCFYLHLLTYDSSSFVYGNIWLNTAGLFIFKPLIFLFF